MRWLGMVLLVTLAAGGLYEGRASLVARRTADGATSLSASATAPGGPRRIYAAGTVEGTHRDVALAFEISGRVRAVRVGERDLVEAGDVLVEIEPEACEGRLAESQARLAQALAERDRLVNGASPENREVLKSEVAAAEVAVRESEGHLARGEQLSRQNAISVQELEELRYRLEKGTAQLRLARARLDELEAPARRDDRQAAEAKVALARATVAQDQTQLEKTRLRAPSRGLVARVDAEPGDLVGPALERDLVTLTNRDRTRVRAYVEELDALDVAPGQPAVVTIDGKPAAKYAGTVESCAAHVRPKSQRHNRPGELVDVRVREVIIELEQGDDLVTGLPVDVFIFPEH